LPYLNQVHFIEALVVPGSLDIQNGDNVLMVEIAQQLHLTQCPQAEHGVVEGGNLFDGDLLAGRLVDGRAGRS
jgi:hypothetical protein